MKRHDDPDPNTAAACLGIDVIALHDFQVRVGSDGHTIVYSWHPDERVRRGRVWEGIAQCILTRRGVFWSEGDAIALAARIRVNHQYH